MLCVNMGKIHILNEFAQNKTVFPEVDLLIILANGGKQ